MLAEADGNSGHPPHTFTNLELAQAAAFVQEAQRMAGGLMTEPLEMLQVRYGINHSRACALAEQLEALGFWAMFVADGGICCAQVLRG